MFENLSISRLQVFCEVAQTKSFRAAAENLKISQPAVSQNISGLEKETRLVLFERGRVNNLTEDGQLLYSYAKRIVELTREAAHNVQELSDGNMGKIRFGANSSLVGGLITSLSKGFLAGNPKAELVLVTGMPYQICEMALGHEISLGIIVGKAKHPDLTSVTIARDEIVIVVGANHPLAEKSTITRHELSQQSFVYNGNPPPYIHSVLSVLAQNGISMTERFMQIDTMESVRKMLKSGIGVSTLPRGFVAEDLRDGLLHEIALESGPLYVDISRIVRKNKFLSPLSRKFIQYIDETAQSIH